jgi:membrane-bound lytic murein transglycosylase D
MIICTCSFFAACAWVSGISHSYGSKAKIVEAKRHISSESFIKDPAIRERFTLPSEKKVSLPAPERHMTTEVRSELKNILNKNRGIFQRVKEEEARSIPILRAILRDEGVPTDLVHIALIESGFRSDLKSPMGARGMWQFMKSTAKLYGLQVGILKDERTDVVLATIAAARHLRDLFHRYEDWNLAIAAYNAGPGTIDKAIKRSGQRDFWILARKRLVRAETIKFVSKLHAILVVLDNPEIYGIEGYNISRNINSEYKPT